MLLIRQLPAILAPFDHASLDPKMAVASVELMDGGGYCRPVQPVKFDTPTRATRRIERKLQPFSAATRTPQTSPFLALTVFDKDEHPIGKFFRRRMFGYGPPDHMRAWDDAGEDEQASKQIVPHFYPARSRNGSTSARPQ